MTFTEIYNLVLACVPTISAIATMLAIFIKFFSTLKSLKADVSDNTKTHKEEIKQLKLENQALRDQARETNKQIQTLTAQVSKVIDKIEIDEQETI